MCSYTDKVIKSLAQDNITAIKEWNKKFTRPFSDDDVQTALRLSDVVDKLWAQVVELRRENARLRMERDLLKRATAFCVKESGQ